MYLSSFCFFNGHFPFLNELATSNSRKGILLTAAHTDFVWNLNFQLGLSSDKFCSLYTCWQSAIHRNIQGAFSWLLYSFISMATKSILSFIAQRLGLWYKFLISLFFNVQQWSNYVCEPSPELRWGSSIKISGAVSGSWDIPYTSLAWSLRHNLAKTARQHTCYLCDESTSGKLILPPSNFPCRLNLQTIFFHLYNI